MLKSRLMSQLPEPKQYLYGLDLVRFMAAVSVMCFHYTWREPGSAGFWPFGWVGVEAFFIISGVVIASSAYGAKPSGFLRSRFLRLYPGAWCAAGVSVFALSVLGGVPLRELLMAVFSSVTLLPGPALESAYWTLPVEIAFYTLVLLMLVWGRFEKYVERIPIALILWSLPFLIASFLHYYGIRQSRFGGVTYHWQQMLLGRWGLYFGMGMQLWLWKNNRLDRLNRVFMVVGLLGAVVELDTRGMAVMEENQLLGSAGHVTHIWMSAGAVCAFLFSFAMIATSVVRFDLFPKSAQLRSVVRKLGLMTYPLYLVHETVKVAVSHQLEAAGSRWNANLVTALLSGTVALAIAFLLSAWVEVRARKLVATMGSRIYALCFQS